MSDTGELINITKLLAILRAVAAGEAASWPDLARRVGLSRTALWRLLKRAEAGMGVCVQVGDEGPRVVAWGVLDRRSVVGGR
jgi:DNA-binding IclR family transcriptional regulator